MHRAGWPFVGAGLAVAALGYKHRWVRTTGLVAAAATRELAVFDLVRTAIATL